jgi:CRISPR-associated endonuclease/helicase Cas3
LDFDVMISQLCPIDLLFQRIGRLHRHSWRVRPNEFSAPGVFLIGGTEPSFDRGTQTVYDEYVLLRTWLALRQREGLRLPEDIGALVETVYEQPAAVDAAPTQERLDAALSRWRKKQAAEKSRAADIYLPSCPDDLDLADITRPFDDDELIAATRLGEFGTAVVCLFPHERSEDDSLMWPGEQEVRRLVGKSITLRQYEITENSEDTGTELPQPSLGPAIPS